MDKPAWIMLLLIISVIVLFAMLIAKTNSYISGGNEIISTDCNESGELRILVGRYNDERKWIGSGLDCQRIDK